MSTGTCANCGKHSYLMRLHGDKGGPLMCPLCAGEWNAKHTRGRRFGRIARRALDLYLQNVHSLDHHDRSPLIQASVVLGLLGDGKINLYGLDDNTETGDITAELLADILQLTHPDRHPPNLQDLAKRVTQELLALKPFVFPAPKPKPPPVYTPPRDGSINCPRETFKEPSPPRYPCELCAETVPYFYCDPCKAEWNKRYTEDRDRKRAKNREQYARRQQRKRMRRPPKLCAADGCTTRIEANRKDAKYCSPACRQRAHRQRVTDPKRCDENVERSVTRRAAA